MFTTPPYPTTWNLCMSAIQYSWKKKSRTAYFYVRQGELMSLRERLLNAGYSVSIIGAMSTDTDAHKIAIRW